MNSVFNLGIYFTRELGIRITHLFWGGFPIPELAAVLVPGLAQLGLQFLLGQVGILRPDLIQHSVVGLVSAGAWHETHLWFVLSTPSLPVLTPPHNLLFYF